MVIVQMTLNVQIYISGLMPIIMARYVSFLFFLAFLLTCKYISLDNQQTFVFVFCIITYYNESINKHFFRDNPSSGKLICWIPLPKRFLKINYDAIFTFDGKKTSA